MQRYMSSKPKAFDELVEQTKDERFRVRKLVRTGRWREAEPDPTRAASFDARVIVAAARMGAEAIIGDTNDLQAVSYLVEGAERRRAVGYVEMNGPTSSTAGSGFLISSRLFLTNCHVIPNTNAARATQVTFDREATVSGVPSPTTVFLLDPDSFALFSTERELDYALLAIGRINSGTANIKELGYCPLSDTPDRHRLGMNVNIIQHPRGLPKMIAIRNNYLTARTDRTLLYDTDTDPGSSGSPVFNDGWDVVALHHWGEPFLETADEGGKKLPVNVNEGVRISAIYRDLQQKLATLPSPQQALLREALAYASMPDATIHDHTLGPPRPRAAGSESSNLINLGNAEAQRSITMSSQNEARVVVPVEIIVRVGASSAASLAVDKAALGAPSHSLVRGAESVQLDEDYTNRDGYKDHLIPGFNVPLPEPDAKLAKQVAPLRAGEKDAEKGELKYEHFSIKMNKSKHLAMFTATNIDGATYLSVNRATGEVSDSSEGDRWFKDSRISETFWTGQDFYSEWSDYFDRGHLTRRTDPTWGTKDQAVRANADTFHFTNCSPQHFRFNQTTKYWQGAERYVLENGLLSTDQQKPIVVFQGPIFDDSIDHYAGDLQIPSSFFKIIVWKGAAGLKAVGLVVDQLQLLAEKRVGLGQPHDVPSVNVSHWRVAIKQIEKRTGLSFGDAVLGADTIKAVAQPVVGEEAIIRIASFEDILRGA